MNQQRILIVEDETPMRTALADLLSAEGYRALTAANGEAGLQRALAEKPDLILLDILLPDLDGLSVCEILRRQPATHETPVIFISALTSDVTKRTVAVHAEDFFTKPIDFMQLEHRIIELLRGESP